MKAYFKKIIYPICIWGVSVVGLFAASRVPLYLEPNAESTIYFSEDAEHLKTLPSEAYPKGADDAQWQRVDYAGEYIGFVESSQVGDDNRVKSGTYVFLEPNQNSPVIAEVLDNTNTVAMDRGDKWSPVSHSGSGYAYYQSSALEAPLASTQSDDVIVAASPPPSPPLPPPAPPPSPLSPPPPAPPPSSSSQQLTWRRGEYETAKSSSVIVEAARPVVPAIDFTLKKTPELSDAKLMRRYTGRFVRLSRFDQLFADHDYPYVMKNAQGKTIACLDLSDVLIFSPIEDYFSKQVVVDGIVENVHGEPPMVLKAQFIQLQ